jgi:hypothetical protein
MAGEWRDYQTDKKYVGERWYEMTVGEIPVVLLARIGAHITEGPVVQYLSAEAT